MQKSQKLQKHTPQPPEIKPNVTKSRGETLLEETKRIIEDRILNIEALWLRVKVLEQRTDNLDDRVNNFGARISQIKYKLGAGNSHERVERHISNPIQLAEEVMRERQKLSDQRPSLQPQTQQTTT